MLTAWVGDTLKALDQTAMRRSLRSSDAAQTNWGSNNYLALATHPRVIAAAREALSLHGAGATASRLIAGHTPLHDALEADLAAYFSREAALVFPSGYMANVGVVTALVGPGDALVMDRFCHASLIDAAKLSGARLFVYAHADPGSAEKALRRAASYRRRLLVTESLFSMDGDFAPLDTLLPLAERHGAMSMVDEAHSLGVWPIIADAPDRPGLPARKARAEADVVVGTLSKALGSQGGFATGSREVMELLVNRSRSFIFTTGLAPACLGAAREALCLIKEGHGEPDRVRSMAQFLRSELQASGWSIGLSQSQIIPILVGEADGALALSERCLQAGHHVPAIRPPTVPQGECRVRISVTAEHKKENILQLLETLSLDGRG